MANMHSSSNLFYVGNKLLNCAFYPLLIFLYNNFCLLLFCGSIAFSNLIMLFCKFTIIFLWYCVMKIIILWTNSFWITFVTVMFSHQFSHIHRFLSSIWPFWAKVFVIERTKFGPFAQLSDPKIIWFLGILTLKSHYH